MQIIINPAKSEMGLVSKKILEKINTSVRNQTSLNQWKNSSSVINWFTNIPNKHKHSFAIFDIDNFYPSISENLLTSAINHAKKYTNITNQDINIIMHSRKSLLFDNGTAWVKKDNESMFDVTMGSYDGAEVCELVGLFILNILCNKYGKENIGLYRDDGLALFNNITGTQAERIKKDNETLQRTRTKDHDQNQPENSGLPGRHTQPNKRNILPLQKTKRRATLHQRKVQPPTHDNQPPTRSHQPKDIGHIMQQRSF